MRNIVANILFLGSLIIATIYLIIISIPEKEEVSFVCLRTVCIESKGIKHCISHHTVGWFKVIHYNYETIFVLVHNDCEEE